MTDSKYLDKQARKGLMSRRGFVKSAAALGIVSATAGSFALPAFAGKTAHHPPVAVIFGWASLAAPPLTASIRPNSLMCSCRVSALPSITT